MVFIVTLSCVLEQKRPEAATLARQKPDPRELRTFPQPNI